MRRADWGNGEKHVDEVEKGKKEEQHVMGRKENNRKNGWRQKKREKKRVRTKKLREQNDKT